MDDEQQRIVDILVKYALYQPLTEEEAHLLERWRQRSEGHRALPDQLRDAEWIAEHRRQLEQVSSPLLIVPARQRTAWRKPVLALILTALAVAGWMLMALQRVEKGHVLLRLRNDTINVVHAP